MKILILSPIEPYPTHGGWSTSIYNVLVKLVEFGHDVFLIANTHDANADLAGMQRVCPTTYMYQPKLPRWRQVLGNVGSALPYSIARYVNPEIERHALATIEREGIDVVLVEDVAMSWYGPRLRAATGRPYYIRTHNIDTQVLRRFKETQRNPLMRGVAAWQERKMARYEARALAAADGCSVLSDADDVALRKLAPGLQADEVGNGTDLDRFVDEALERDPDVISHVGTLTAFTKLEPMVWFCQHVLPRVRERRQQARLQLVGAVPEGVFGRYEGVEVVGRVADERPYLARGGAFVAVQFTGSGVRLKILNALATGNAVVCTCVAGEGLPLVDGRHALIRDEAPALADAIVQVLGDDKVRRELGTNGRALVAERFDWRPIVRKLEQRLLQLCNQDAESVKG